MNNRCIVVFTSRAKLELISEGGSQAWVLDPARARRCAYLVCAWNPYGAYQDGAQLPHGQAFLIAKISGVEPAPEDPSRYIIRFSEYSDVAIPNVWHGWRNPVKYSELAEIGVDLSNIEFSRATQDAGHISGSHPLRRATPKSLAAPNALSIAQAKTALAAFYQVPPDSIEITIRG